MKSLLLLAPFFFLSHSLKFSNIVPRSGLVRRGNRGCLFGFGATPVYFAGSNSSIGRPLPFSLLLQNISQNRRNVASACNSSQTNDHDSSQTVPGNVVGRIEKKDNISDCYYNRFSGVGRLYGGIVGTSSEKFESSSMETKSDEESVDTWKNENVQRSVLDRLSASTVVIIGIGGVGSWAAEALCRSGVGNLILIDMDDICISNTNRQLHALSSTVGKSKIHEMKKRLRDINPECHVITIFDFVSKDNIETILDSLLILKKDAHTVCIDAIDNEKEKASIIMSCVARGLPIVTCGGAAGKTDPTKIVCEDLTKAYNDRLLFKCRKRLRQHHGFPKGPSSGMKNTHRVKKWNISAVFSTEVQKPLTAKERQASTSFRQCDGALGTACFVTGSYGFTAAGRVVEMIAKGQLDVPNIPFKK